jgi:hypothetical protein
VGQDTLLAAEQQANMIAGSYIGGRGDMSGSSWREHGNGPDDGPRRRNAPFTYASRNNTRPNPPFMCSDVTFGYHSFGIDPERVAPFLPPGLVPTKEHLAYTAVISVGDTWSLGPFSHATGGVVVDNHESPDGSEGAFVLFSYHSAAVRPVFREHYDGTTLTGDCCVWDEDGIWWSTVGPPGRPPDLRVGVRPETEPITIDGIDLYMSRNGDGHLVDWTVCHNGSPPRAWRGCRPTRPGGLPSAPSSACSASIPAPRSSLAPIPGFAT